MDPAVAFEQAWAGASLLLLNLPAGTIVTIDQTAYPVGPLFKGVKMVPPGPHFVGYNAGSKHNEYAPTVGFFVHLGASQVEVRAWNAPAEQLEPLEDEQQAERLKLGVRNFDFDRHLAPYDRSRHAQWRLLTSCISPATIHRLLPQPAGQFSCTAEPDAFQADPHSAAEQALQAQLRSGRPHAAGSGGHQASSSHTSTSKAPEGGPGRCSYTQIPRLAKGQGRSAAELTALNLDKSPLIQECISSRLKGDPQELVAEMQWAFVAFLMGHSLEGLLQWRAVLLLLLGSFAYPQKLPQGPQLYCPALKALREQLALIFAPTGGPGGSAGGSPMEGLLEMEELLRGSFLRPQLDRFFEGLEGWKLDLELMRALDSLKQLLANVPGWQMRVEELTEGLDEDDEDAPVIVEL